MAEDRDRAPRAKDETGLQRLAESAALKLLTAAVTFFMVPLVWRIADTMTQLRTDAVVMEIRVKTLENLVPQRGAAIGELHDGQLNLTSRVGELERTCKRNDGH